MLPRHLISAKEGLGRHRLLGMQTPELEEEGSSFCLPICFFMVLKIGEGLSGEWLREDSGCCSDVLTPDDP